jgi:hypothetical protein
MKDAVAAISVGIVEGTPLLDLEYIEDSACDTDMNVVMTGAGGFVELQGTAEGVAFTRARDGCAARPGRQGHPRTGGPCSAPWGFEMRLVLASNNAKKLVELQALFAPLGLSLVTQGSLGIPKPRNLSHLRRERADQGPPCGPASGSAGDRRRLGPVRRCAGGRARRAVGALRHWTLFGRAQERRREQRTCCWRTGGVADRARVSSAPGRGARADDPEPLIAMGRWRARS